PGGAISADGAIDRGSEIWDRGNLIAVSSETQGDLPGYCPGRLIADESCLLPVGQIRIDLQLAVIHPQLPQMANVRRLVIRHPVVKKIIDPFDFEVADDVAACGILPV